jgi:hypothetical protein
MPVLNNVGRDFSIRGLFRDPGVIEPLSHRGLINSADRSVNHDNRSGDQ